MTDFSYLPPIWSKCKEIVNYNETNTQNHKNPIPALTTRPFGTYKKSFCYLFSNKATQPCIRLSNFKYE